MRASGIDDIHLEVPATPAHPNGDVCPPTPFLATGTARITQLRRLSRQRRQA
jgi:hypothetical protein